MKTVVPALAIVAALGAGAAYAASEAGHQDTIGQLLAKGEISQSAVQQLIMHTGLTMDQAKSETLDEIVARRWQNS
jgi:hypothetical protein